MPVDGEVYQGSSTVTIDCLPQSIINNQDKNVPIQLTCHTSDNKIEMPCNAISLTYKRNIGISETKKPTSIQVVALAKGNLEKIKN